MAEVKQHYYLAGPFFNAAQRDVAQWIAAMAKNNKLSYHAPIEMGFEKITNADVAAKVVKKNIEEIKKATVIIANLDWALPPHERVIHQKIMDGMVINLNIPDSGTVWEMGFAHALGKPIVGFSLTSGPRKANIMLTETCVGFFYAREEILKFLALPHPKNLEYAATKKWSGSLI